MPWPPRFTRIAAHFGGVGPSAVANTVRRTLAQPGPTRRLRRLRRLLGEGQK